MFLQAQISTSQWPQDGYWPQLIETFKIAYKSRIIDALSYNKYILNGPDCYNSDSYLQNMDALKNYRDANLMKVRCSKSVYPCGVVFNNKIISLLYPEFSISYRSISFLSLLMLKR